MGVAQGAKGSSTGRRYGSEQAQYDRADEGQGQIGTYNAQSTGHAHGMSPKLGLQVHVAGDANDESSNPFHRGKVSSAAPFLDWPAMEPALSWLKIAEINALKSP
jgi:hypothetical protein